MRKPQDVGRLREGGYPSMPEQLGALCKMVDTMAALLTPAQRAQLPADALAVLDAVRATKTKYPKGGKKHGNG